MNPVTLAAEDAPLGITMQVEGYEHSYKLRSVHTHRNDTGSTVTWRPAGGGMLSFALGEQVTVTLPAASARFEAGDHVTFRDRGVGEPRNGTIDQLANEGETPDDPSVYIVDIVGDLSVAAFSDELTLTAHN